MFVSTAIRYFWCSCLSKYKHTQQNRTRQKQILRVNFLERKCINNVQTINISIGIDFQSHQGADFMSIFFISIQAYFET